MLGDRIAAALYGGAIGDAMGAPVEGWMPAAIAERFAAHDLRSFLPPTHGGDPNTGKGAGRVTDDTLMVEVLINAYLEHGGHMDAYGYADYMVPRIGQADTFVPERQREMPLFDRLWFPEKYPYIRLHSANADPRSAGVGNCVNCGVAMWIWPAGAVNAGDPAGAYQEAAAIAAAHNESFAVEAAAVMAAAAAAALARDATIDAACEAAAELARDGTAGCVRAALAAADPADDLADWIARTRAAVEPFDQRRRHVADDQPLLVRGVSDVGRPSRLHAIEETPVALAALKYGAGDWAKTIRAAVFYGRDCDSIAAMACALFGAVFGTAAVPGELRAASDAANRRDWADLAAAFTRSVRQILNKDIGRFESRRAAVR